MFEAEVAMERRSSFLPLLLMLCLVVAIVGLVGYVIFQVKGQTPLTAQQATTIVAASVQGPGRAITHFHTGLLKAGGDEEVTNPNYRLLEKAGILKLAKSGKSNIEVSLTPDGERLLTSLPGFKKSKEEDGTFLYSVPLAERQFVSVASVNMVSSNGATVEYNWKWAPNQLGNVFDAGGALVKSFNLWDRQTLINKHGVDFYNATTAKSTLALVRDGREWKVPAR